MEPLHRVFHQQSKDVTLYLREMMRTDLDSEGEREEAMVR